MRVVEHIFWRILSVASKVMAIAFILVGLVFTALGVWTQFDGDPVARSQYGVTAVLVGIGLVALGLCLWKYNPFAAWAKRK
jgi:uncharacterized membrane protein YidH (DUF202 family)